MYFITKHLGEQLTADDHNCGVMVYFGPKTAHKQYNPQYLLNTKSLLAENVQNEAMLLMKSTLTLLLYQTHSS